MREAIIKELQTIEKQENVTIIYACESGSRAWGFASADSDYDVRFLYVKPYQDYVKLEGVRDVITWRLDDTWDVNGWDLQKTLKLLHKSNPSIYEWLYSPVVYLQTPSSDAFKELLGAYFDRKKLLYHYLHMARRNQDALKAEEISVKKYFYVLRPLFAALWLLEREGVPPVWFDDLRDITTPEMNRIIDDLLTLKRQGDESLRIKMVPALDSYIEEKLCYVEKQADSLASHKKSWQPLNDFFLSQLKIGR